MPWKVCSTAGCANLIEHGSKCDKCRSARDTQRRPTGNPYNSQGHQWFRHQVLARDPRCVCTGQCGQHKGMCAKPSTIADHYPTERVDLIAQGLNPNNPAYGRGICKACHDSKTARSKPAGFNDQTKQ
jgi:5-methylcytosine-specific restriction protein A